MQRLNDLVETSGELQPVTPRQSERFGSQAVVFAPAGTSLTELWSVSEASKWLKAIYLMLSPGKPRRNLSN